MTSCEIPFPTIQTEDAESEICGKDKIDPTKSLAAEEFAQGRKKSQERINKMRAQEEQERARYSKQHPDPLSDHY